MLGVVAVVGGTLALAMAGARSQDKAKARAKAKAAGMRSPRTAHNIAEGTVVPSFSNARALAGKRTRRGVECPPLPWMDDEVNYVIRDAIANKQVLDERVLLLMALHEVYDCTEDGRPLQWPTVPEDCAALKLLEERTRARVRHFLAEVADTEAGMIYEDIE